MNKAHIHRLSIDFFLNESSYNKLKTAIEIIRKVQLNLLALSEKDGEEVATSIKSGTVFVLALLSKILSDENINSPKDFSKDDWKDIANAVSDYAVFMDSQSYAEFVFGLYAGYIEFSVHIIESRITPENAQAIKMLSEQLKINTTKLRKGELSETEYIEQCLWISLEALIKLLSATLGSLCGKDAEEFSVALASVAFEYGRITLYKKELALLSEYIEHQHCLDAELEEKYFIFLNELQAQNNNFMALIGNAFEPDFNSRLHASAMLAYSAGVSENEILDTKEKIDDFFLN